LGEEYKSFSYSLCNLLHSPVTSSLLGPNILLNTMFSNTLSFLSSLNVSDQVSRPYKTTGKIIVPYNLIFKFLDSKLEDERFTHKLYTKQHNETEHTKQNIHNSKKYVIYKIKHKHTKHTTLYIMIKKIEPKE